MGLGLLLYCCATILRAIPPPWIIASRVHQFPEARPPRLPGSDVLQLHNKTPTATPRRIRKRATNFLSDGMCGIFCIVSRHGYQSPSSNGTCLLQHRGPDSLQEHRTKLKTEANEDVYLSFSSSVLSLRGTAVVSQPLVDETSGSVLCWNGEAWKLSGNTVQGNDSKALFELLVLAAVSAESYSNVLSILEETRGPYALVFYDGHSKKLYFGRDCLGRRSLLRTSTTTGDLVISSVCDLTLNTPWFEIEAEGVHVIDLSLPAPTEPSLEHTFPEHLVPHTTLYLDPPGQNIKSIVSPLFSTIPTKLNDCPDTSVFRSQQDYTVQTGISDESRFNLCVCFRNSPRILTRATSQEHSRTE